MMNDDQYKQWRETKLRSYPASAKELVVEIGGLINLSKVEKTAILKVCERANMVIYRCRDEFVDRASLRAFSAEFGLHRTDHHLCANDDGVSELTVAAEGPRSSYAPYSNRSLSWHTDGYYNERSQLIQAVVLHCSEVSMAGGENALLDHEMVYIMLRDEDPRFISAFEHPECMTIPANKNSEIEIRPEVTGPVFSYLGNNRKIHMRFSARKRNIRWREDQLTDEARHCLKEILGDDNGPVLRYRLQPGEGLISNNVLHNRTEFNDGKDQKRLIYRARFLDRVMTVQNAN